MKKQKSALSGTLKQEFKKDLELFEKQIGHLAVVMLAGVDERQLGRGPGFHFPGERRDFHEIRACARDYQQMHEDLVLEESKFA